MTEKPFQLEPKDFKTGNFLVDQAIGNAVKSINKVDFNHNGVPDVAEIAPVVVKVLPLVVALNAAVDFEKLAEQLAENPAIKDKALLRETLKELGAIAEHAGKLLPH